MTNFYTSILYLLSFSFLLFSCSSPTETPMKASNLAQASNIEEANNQIWVYTHAIKAGHDYTVFATEKPTNKAVLPGNFLAIKNKKREDWTCLMKWEDDVLWFYTPSSRSFASHNSENGKTQWTIIEEKDYNYFFYEEEETDFIRFSSHCDTPDVLCLNAEEMVISN